jgi:hypothetical protein
LDWGSAAKPLPTDITAQTQNKRTQTSMPRVGFELINTVFERTTAVHALDRAATVTGDKTDKGGKYSNLEISQDIK